MIRCQTYSENYIEIFLKELLGFFFKALYAKERSNIFSFT